MTYSPYETESRRSCRRGARRRRLHGLRRAPHHANHSSEYHTNHSSEALSLPKGAKVVAESHGIGSRSIGTVTFNGKEYLAGWCNGQDELHIRLEGNVDGSTTGVACLQGTFGETDFGTKGRYHLSVHTTPNTTWELLLGTN